MLDPVDYANCSVARDFNSVVMQQLQQTANSRTLSRYTRHLDTMLKTQQINSSNNTKLQPRMRTGEVMVTQK